ncbi:hypothetical protein EDB85DRAFT_1893034 [Lactarius pseudohatsudake]|nr:hypothetical protein EDB85DRAFT_1893034 [Lactarius pseudohatsudake]
MDANGVAEDPHGVVALVMSAVWPCNKCRLVCGEKWGQGSCVVVGGRLQSVIGDGDALAALSRCKEGQRAVGYEDITHHMAMADGARVRGIPDLLDGPMDIDLSMSRSLPPLKPTFLGKPPKGGLPGPATPFISGKLVAEVLRRSMGVGQVPDRHDASATRNPDRGDGSNASNNPHIPPTTRGTGVGLIQPMRAATLCRHGPQPPYATGHDEDAAGAKWASTTVHLPVRQRRRCGGGVAPPPSRVLNTSLVAFINSLTTCFTPFELLTSIPVLGHKYNQKLFIVIILDFELLGERFVSTLILLWGADLTTDLIQFVHVEYYFNELNEFDHPSSSTSSTPTSSSTPNALVSTPDTKPSSTTGNSVLRTKTNGARKRRRPDHDCDHDDPKETTTMTTATATRRQWRRLRLRRQRGDHPTTSNSATMTRKEGRKAYIEQKTPSCSASTTNCGANYICGPDSCPFNSSVSAGDYPDCDLKRRMSHEVYARPQPDSERLIEHHHVDTRTCKSRVSLTPAAESVAKIGMEYRLRAVGRERERRGSRWNKYP